MALSKEQIKQNIEAMEEQGASREEVQEYLDSLRTGSVKRPAPTSRFTPEEQQSLEETGAMFPAKTGEGPVKAGIKSALNIPTSAIGLGRNILSAVFNPIDTAKGVFGAVKGGGEKFGREIIEKTRFADRLPKESQEEQTFNALAQHLKDRFGSLEAIQRTATNDPVGFGADIVPILQGVRVASAGSKVTQVAEEVSQAMKQPIKSRLNDAAVNQMEKAINLNPSDTRRIQRPNVAGQNPSEWLVERGFQGSQKSIVQQLDDYRFETKSAVDDGLEALTEVVPLERAGSAVQTLEILKDVFQGTVGNEGLVARLDELLQKDSLTLTEMNEIKRLAQAELDVFKSTGALKEGAKAKGLNNVVSDLKTSIETEAARQGFNDVKALNKETQVSKEISDSIQKRLDVQNKLPAIGLRDGIIAVGGFATGNPLIGAGLIIGKKTLESSQFRTALAQKLATENPVRITELEKAIEQHNYAEIIQYLAPLVNEFEEGTQEVRENATQ